MPYTPYSLSASWNDMRELFQLPIDASRHTLQTDQFWRGLAVDLPGSQVKDGPDGPYPIGYAWFARFGSRVFAAVGLDGVPFFDPQHAARLASAPIDLHNPELSKDFLLAVCHARVGLYAYEKGVQLGAAVEKTLASLSEALNGSEAPSPTSTDAGVGGSVPDQAKLLENADQALQKYIGALRALGLPNEFLIRLATVSMRTHREFSHP